MNDASQYHPSDLLRQQSVLAKFGELALCSEDLDEILTEACHLVCQGLGTELAKVMELKEDGETLVVRAGVGWNPGVVGIVTIKATDATAEREALKSREPIISPDIETETRFHYPSFLSDHGVKAVVNVLIIGREGRVPFGLLQIDSRTPRVFNDSDVAFLRGYANLLAAAVDRLRVVRELRERDSRLRLALEASGLGSWDLDLSSGNATRTLRYNQIFGIVDPLSNWSYDDFLDHVLPEDRDDVAEAFRRATEIGADWHVRFRIRRADDRAIRWVEMRGRPDDDPQGKGTRLLGILADITEPRETEEQLRRTNEVLEAHVAERTRDVTDANVRLLAEAHERERVEEALRQAHKMEAVGQLTGGLAHDFNNLLQSISGSLDLTRARVAQGRMADVDVYLDLAKQSVARAATLIHSLLAFSRRQTLDPRPTDLNQLVQGMANLFHGTLGPTVRLEVKPAVDLWLTLCDPGELQSGLLNLIINARDAMPDGGSLVIETRNTHLPDRRGKATPVALQHLPPGQYVVLSVADTGSGMSPTVIARAFDPFFTTKPFGKGTGLGLSTIYGFVEQSGGQVMLESAEGEGATVVVYLPRHLGMVDAPVALLPPPATTAAVVLVVEDEPSVRMFLVDVLSELGYAVFEAGDVRSALRVLEAEAHIDLLVTDIGLPGGLNGRQLADAACGRRPGLKVLFITGYDVGEVFTNDQLRAGMEVMTKPFSTEAFAARIEAMLRV